MSFKFGNQGLYKTFTYILSSTIGGSTVVSSATTTATDSMTVIVWGEYTYTESAVTETLGGSTTVIGGTTLPPVTTTVTPGVYPTDKATTHDTKLNKNTIHWTSDTPASPTASAGCSGCGSPCE